jgi:transcriptional regulator with XRE-family HTH domain
MKTEVSDIDKVIGQRLRQFREQLKVSRTSFALEIGIGSERLASYEAGRVPLRWSVFSAISQRFFLNPFWLATGESLPQLDAPFEEIGLMEVAPRSRFSDIFLSVVKEAGNTGESMAILQKITRAGHLLSEILKYGQSGVFTREMSAKLLDMASAWREVGSLAEKKARAEMARNDAIVKCTTGRFVVKSEPDSLRRKPSKK